MKNRGLAFKLVVFTLAGTTTIFLFAFTWYFLASRATVIRNVEESARNLALSTVHRIESFLITAEKAALNYSTILSKVPYEPADVPLISECLVDGNPEVYGSAIAFEPWSVDSYYYSPYCYRKDGNLVNTSLGDESYQYFLMDWYQIAKELDRPCWSEPYFDEGGGNIVMATFSAPFYKQVHGTRIFQGVVTADVSMNWLQQMVSTIKLYGSGYAFLITRNGVFVTHPDSSLVMKETIFNIADEKDSLKLRRLGQDMTRGGEGLASLEKGLLSDKASWLYYAPLPAAGWSLGIVVPEGELLADVHRLGQQVVFIVMTGLLMMGLVIVLIARRITRPLKSLADMTVEIASGNLDAELPPIGTGDEIGKLAGSFEGMRLALKSYVRNLAETTAAKERYESELKIARNIQLSFLPKEFPRLQSGDRFQISARLESARDIGGDLYEFFLLDEDHLFFSIGDVSDKGIPAALFMAVTKTLLKSIAEPGMEPSEILDRTNLELCRENDSMMFVTLFCGILNTSTGALRYSNAGHLPPIIIRQDQRHERLELPAGFLLGAIEESRYKSMTTRLEPGEVIILYTDGVTEAMNGAGELYTEERLMETLSERKRDTAEEYTSDILLSVKSHSSDVQQSDDIAVLALSFAGPRNK